MTVKRLPHGAARGANRVKPHLLASLNSVISGITSSKVATRNHLFGVQRRTASSPKRMFASRSIAKILVESHGRSPDAMHELAISASERRKHGLGARSVNKGGEWRQSVQPMLICFARSVLQYGYYRH